MNHNSALHHDLVPSLKTSIQLSHQLEEALLAETRAVESRDLEAIQSAVAQKQSLLQTLEAETRQQREWVESTGGDFTPDGMARLFLRLENGPELEAHWQALHQSVERCNTLNRGNARLIDRNRRRVDVSMQILRGEDPGPATLYDPHGRARPSHRSGQRITRA